MFNEPEIETLKKEIALFKKNKDIKNQKIPEPIWNKITHLLKIHTVRYLAQKLNLAESTIYKHKQNLKNLKPQPNFVEIPFKIEEKTISVDVKRANGAVLSIKNMPESTFLTLIKDELGE